MSPTTQKRTTTTVPRPRPDTPSAEGEARTGAAPEVEQQPPGITLPIVNTRIAMPRQLPRLAMPQVSMPRIPLLERVPRPPLPPASSLPGRLIWVGGLGAVAALGVIEWPVAAAVAAGTWVAEQRAKEQRRAGQVAPLDR